MPGEPAPTAFVPARRAPLLYLGFAHACLWAAFALLAARPAALGGFYYHPRLIAVVHLVTLGFITSAILGALYLVCPLALRLPMREGRADTVAALSWMVGVSGVASHFWLERYPGMAWSGGMALATALWVGGRVLAGLRRAPVPLEAKLPIALALLNLYAAGGLGVLLGVHKYRPFLPLSQLDGVHAHLHLAAVGFATLMVVGVGYRMLPMVLPAAMPRGRAALASGLVLEAGVLGLAGALVFAKSLTPAFALLTLAGLGLFLSRVAFMLRNRRPAPADRPRPDWPLVHVLQALAYLGVTGALGLYLACAPASEASLRAAFAYGVCGLVGFLCQLVVGVEARLLPLAAWIRGFADGGYQGLPPSVHSVAPRAAAAVPVVLWTLGVPSLAAGLSFDSPAATSVGATALAVAVLVTAASGVRALRRLGAVQRSASERDKIAGILYSVAEALRTASLYRGLSEEDRQRIAEVALVKSWDKGEGIFHEGDPSDFLLTVLSGRVKVVKLQPSGREVILEIFGPGDPVGAVVAYEGRPFPATAIALERTTCLLVRRGPFFGLLEKHPSLVRGLLSTFTRRIVELAQRIPEVAGSRVETRFAHLFLKLADRVGRPREGAMFIPMPLSRQELADLTGTTIETCIRLMSRWGKERVIETDKDGFVLHDRSALEQLTQA